MTVLCTWAAGCFLRLQFQFAQKHILVEEYLGILIDGQHVRGLRKQMSTSAVLLVLLVLLDSSTIGTISTISTICHPSSDANASAVPYEPAEILTSTSRPHAAAPLSLSPTSISRSVCAQGQGTLPRDGRCITSEWS